MAAAACVLRTPVLEQHVAAFGAAKYYELIFERETLANAMPPTMEHDSERVGA